MLFSFILFSFIGLIPYVAAYFGLGIEYQYTKKVLGTFFAHFSIFAVIKLFLVALILPEVEGFKIQSFIINMVISSLEFVAYHHSLKKKNDICTKTITYWWSVFTVLISSVLTYISNSRTYELEIEHIVYAFASSSYIIQWFAAKNLSASIQKNKSIFQFDLKTQIMILLLGLPQAFGSLESIQGYPVYLSDVLRVASSCILYFVTSLFIPKEKKEKQQ